MINISTAPVKKLLGLAIRSEIDSNKIYSDLANRVTNPLLREKLHLLAFEENKHKIALETLHKSLFKEDEISIPEKTDESLLPSIHYTPSSSLVDFLYQAMEAEKSAENFYLNLSRRVEKDQRKILEYLSHVEHSHYMMLKSEYTLAQDFEDYAEKDIDKVIT